MILRNVQKAIAARAQTITDFQQVSDRPVDSITTPAAMVGYPDTIQYDVTYGRGADRMTIPLYVVVAKVSDAAAADQLDKFADGTGTDSVKQVLESGTYTAFDFVVVTSVEFQVITVQAVDYLAAIFNLDIVGSGA